MNIPYGCVSVAANEALKAKMKRSNSGDKLGVGSLLACGGLAGAVASLATTPLDVVKTRLQTQHLTCSLGAASAMHDFGTRSLSTAARPPRVMFSGVLRADAASHIAARRRRGRLLSRGGGAGARAGAFVVVPPAKGRDVAATAGVRCVTRASSPPLARARGGAPCACCALQGSASATASRGGGARASVRVLCLELPGGRATGRRRVVDGRGPRALRYNMGYAAGAGVKRLVSLLERRGALGGFREREGARAGQRAARRPHDGSGDRGPGILAAPRGARVSNRQGLRVECRSATPTVTARYARHISSLLAKPSRDCTPVSTQLPRQPGGRALRPEPGG